MPPAPGGAPAKKVYTDEERAKNAADRARQRRNKRALAEGRPLEPTPAQAAALRTAQEAVSPPTQGSLSVGTRAQTKRSVKRERENDGKEYGDSSQDTSSKRRKLTRTASAGSTTSDINENEMLSDLDRDSSESHSENDHTFGDKKTKPRYLQLPPVQCQNPPSKEDMLTITMVDRDGNSVPRLASMYPINRESIEKKNGVELARVLENQSASCYYEMSRSMQENNSLAWRRLQQTVLKLTDLEKAEEKYPTERFEKSEMESSNHSYLVPEDYCCEVILSDDSSDDGDGSQRLPNVLNSIRRRSTITPARKEPKTADKENKSVYVEKYSKSTEVSELGKPPVDSKFSDPLPSKSARQFGSAEVSLGDTAEMMMQDFRTAFHFHRGERLDSKTRELVASNKINADRVQRFELFWRENSQKRKQVKRYRESVQPKGLRTPTVLRAAFDHLASQLDGPKGHWKTNAQWFLATLDVIDTEINLCMLVFEPRRRHFEDELKQAMIKADEKRYLKLLEKRCPEEYADLIGRERDEGYVDVFLWFAEAKS